MLKSVVRMGVLASAAVLGAAPVSTAQAAWEPTRPVEIVVPAGPGGGADQMARVVQGIVTKHGLMKQSLIVVNKAGGAGGEGFLDVKGSRANPHKLIITLVQPVHHAAGDRHSVQLEGPHAGRDARARRVRALGERRQAVQVGQGIYRRRSRPRLPARSRWAAPAPSRKTRSSPSRSRRPRTSSSPTSPTRAAAKSRCSSSAATSTPP